MVACHGNVAAAEATAAIEYQPEEVADVLLWLCSPQSSFIAGHALAVAGGAFA